MEFGMNATQLETTPLLYFLNIEPSQQL